MPDDIRYGVIGTGMMGVEHVENLAAIDGATVTAVCDPHPPSIDNALAAIPWNERVAKNIIVFIGDGMSIPTLTAARIYKAQLQDEDFDRPEKNYLTMERFPHMGHSKVNAYWYFSVLII